MDRIVPTGSDKQDDAASAKTMQGDREALAYLICTCDGSGPIYWHSPSCQARIDRVLAAGFVRSTEADREVNK